MNASRHALLLAASLSSGCALVLTKAPPRPIADPRAPLDCTTLRGPSGVDLALGAAFAVPGVVLVTAPCTDGFEDRCTSQRMKLSALTLLPAALFALSGAGGLRANHLCSVALDLQRRCRGGDAAACLALTGGAGLEIQEPAARPSGTVPAP